jgi:hypothetical protein
LISVNVEMDVDRLNGVPDRQQPPPEPPKPPEGPPQPTTAALTPTPPGSELAIPSGMPGQREGRPTTISEAALQVTLKWMDHMSDAAELALGDPELAEAQALSVATFFGGIFNALQPHFPETVENGKATPGSPFGRPSRPR